MDDEGFSVIPVHPAKEDDSWESSSDSGSDNEEKTRSKLKVRMRHAASTLYVILANLAILKLR